MRNTALDLPWVTGLKWDARLGQGEYGVKSGYSAEFSFQDLRLRIYTRWSLSPAMLLHLNAAVDASSPQQAQGLQALTQRQLPQITQRLNATLDKPRSPPTSRAWCVSC